MDPCFLYYNILPVTMVDGSESIKEAVSKISPVSHIEKGHQKHNLASNVNDDLDMTRGPVRVRLLHKIYRYYNL